MKAEMIERWKQLAQNLKLGHDIPNSVCELIIDVFDKWGQFIEEYDYENTLFIWRESVEFCLEPKVDKRHFSQASLDKMVKRHEGFYKAMYWKSDGSCANTLRFYFKRPER